MERLELPGLKPERRTLLPGGLEILQALTELCEIAVPQPAKAALRQGVIIDLHDRSVGQIAAADPLVQERQQRFKVDIERSSRVTTVDLELHRLLRPDAPSSRRRELGRAVSKRRHHRHGANLLSHTGTHGLPIEERQRLASLVLGQRGGLAKVALALRDTEFAWQLLCRRLAVILCDDQHSSSTYPALRLQRCDRQLRLALQRRESDQGPRTADSFREEMALWTSTTRRDITLAELGGRTSCSWARLSDERPLRAFDGLRWGRWPAQLSVERDGTPKRPAVRSAKALNNQGHPGATA